MAIFGRQRLAIDLGTSTTILSMNNRGTAVREVTAVAYDKKEKKMLAFGDDAAKLIGKTNDDVEVIFPIRHGVINDFEATKALLQHLINKAFKRTMNRSEAIVTVPSSITQVEWRALVDALRDIGIYRAMIVRSTIATALGAGIDIDKPEGHLVINIGGGTTDIAIISFGEIIAEDSILMAGDAFNRQIQAAVRKFYNMIISDHTAETIKQTIGNADYNALDSVDTIEITGRSVATGIPVQAVIQSKIIANALDEGIQEIAQAVRNLVELAPPEIISDIARNGMTLSGGGALLRRLPERLSKELNTPVHLMDKPIDGQAAGAAKMISNLQREVEAIKRHRF